MKWGRGGQDSSAAFAQGWPLVLGRLPGAGWGRRHPPAHSSAVLPLGGAGGAAAPELGSSGVPATH